MSRPAVIVVRHPDYANTFTTYPGDGEPDDQEQWQDFASAHAADILDLESAGQDVAARNLRELIESLEPDRS